MTALDTAAALVTLAAAPERGALITVTYACAQPHIEQRVVLF